MDLQAAETDLERGVVLADLSALAKVLEADRKPRPGEPRDPVVRHLAAAVIHLGRAGRPGGQDLALGVRTALGELERVVYFLGSE